MNVFISWSLPRSEAIAKAIHWWLPKVVHFVERFMSEEDIEKGTRPMDRINNELDQSNIGIICITPENQTRPWINYEAGAIAKKVGVAKVMTVVYGLSSSDVRGPLGQFQHTELASDEVKRKSEFFSLVRSINESGGAKKISDFELGENFEMWWPQLEQKLAAISNITADSLPKGRTPNDKIDEILETVRALHRNEADRLAWDAAKQDANNRALRNFIVHNMPMGGPLNPSLPDILKYYAKPERPDEPPSGSVISPSN